MNRFKRLGAVLVTLLALAAVMTGAVLAAEPGDGSISVQLNGEPLAFTDAAPESSDGRTFVPLRAVLEAMDAQVDYDRQTDTVSIHRDGVDLSMVLGENQAAVTEDGQTRTITMDVVPYVKNDRTYVPVRFVAEAFGCSVGWDQSAKTVIIVDVDALFGDATFDLLENFSAYCSKHEAGNMALTGTLDLNVTDQSGTMLAKPVTAKGGIDGITSDKGLQMSWNLKLSGLSDLVGTAGSTPLEQAMVQGMLSALSDLDGEIRVDLEGMDLYLTLPGVLTGAEEDTWYSLDLEAYQAQLLSGLDMTQLSQLEDAGFRETLTAVLKNLPVNDSQTSYDTLAMMASLYVEMLSDQAFTQKGSTYVAQMTLEDVVDLTVTLTKKGEDIVAADIEMSCDVTENGEKAVMTMTEHAAPDKVTINMSLEAVSSGVSVQLDMDVAGVPTQKVPVIVPPAGAQVTPMG